MSSDEQDVNPDVHWIENDVLQWWEDNKNRYASQDMLSFWQGAGLAIGASIGSTACDAGTGFPAAKQMLEDIFQAALDEMEKAYDCDCDDRCGH